MISIFIFTAESSISGNLSETSFPPLSSFLHYLEKMGKLEFVKYIIKYHIILYTFFCLYWYTFFQSFVINYLLFFFVLSVPKQIWDHFFTFKFLFQTHPNGAAPRILWTSASWQTWLCITRRRRISMTCPRSTSSATLSYPQPHLLPIMVPPVGKHLIDQLWNFV